MATNLLLTISFLVLAWTVAFANAAKPSQSAVFNRSSFPKGFLFGAGSSAYQYEGATKYGRGPSIWDSFIRNQPGRIVDGSNAETADDFYHRYKEDIKLMKYIGLPSFRFSISWSRIFPRGKISGGVNPLGVQFYNDLIDELLANGQIRIEPFVTLLHFDPPQALEDEYGGLLSPRIVKDFADYANFCFKKFGDRVKMWVTLNEPNLVAAFGYDMGLAAPGRCSNYVGNCTAGNSSTEPYVAGHNLLLSHATAAKLYKHNYQAKQKGQIGITVAATWFVPKYNRSSDRLAASRMLDFNFGWFLRPVVSGNYPRVMRQLVGSRLPKFTKEESNTLQGSFDFLAVNYYTASYVQSEPPLTKNTNLSYSTDGRTNTTAEKNGVPIGTPTAFPGLYIYPQGLYDLLLYVKKTYHNPTIYITENGMADSSSLPFKTALKDGMRIRYFNAHLCYLLKAIKDGVKVKGYYMWTFLDDFEWISGYTVRFGMVYVDYQNHLRRHLKSSAHWFKKFLSG